MANLKEVRNRISSVTSTQQITKAMKMVSAAKLKRATNAIVQLRPYADKLKSILANLSASLEESNSPFIVEREPVRVLIVAVSSNRGLAGAFNMNVIKATNLLISGKYAEQQKKGNVTIVAIGKKTQDFYEKRGSVFVYVVSPSKAAHLPEYFVDRVPCPSTPAARARLVPDYVGALQQGGIHVVDTASLIHSLKGTYPFDLFPQGGVHWNDVGGARAVSAIVDAINQQAGRELIPPFTFTYTLSKPASGADRELADLLNVFFPPLGLTPGVDYKPVMSGGYDKSVLGVLRGDYDMAPVASDILERMISRGEVKAADVVNPLNTVWTLVAAFLVFGMQVGFTMLEAGFCRSRETVNVLMECIVDTCLCGLLFFAWGFSFMFSHGNGFIGYNWFFLQGAPATYEATGVAFLAFWLFQFAFADTCSTITSGAMIGRTGFWGDLLYSFGVSGFIYPIIGHWAWGPDGALMTMGSADHFLPWVGTSFHDFADSTVVHTIGGFIALAGAIVLGPRLGRRFKRDGGGPMLPHDLTIAACGGLLLWFGWYGFNPGSTLSAMDFEGIGRVAANTTLAACAAGLTATQWLPDRADRQSRHHHRAARHHCLRHECGQ